ncbi:MAG: hypothetical protein A2Y62_10605 [Candidatus Fischerbacteria bacterium RBG_13_37_8]|uniref:ABC-2 type transporter domain-containing protein n=1 Tax=Candidatus Fischerbacteria bacterium RBG_13_37_8 TaxID=1817863 RepID=A0A1F5VTV8_9BACT|nr:MAG: hypothetical protein A2Y62_10605 [Candidatus Fischerbacteria bacterium RBG_13_37_8]
MIKKEFRDVGIHSLFWVGLTIIGYFMYMIIERFGDSVYSAETIWVFCAFGLLPFSILIGLSAFGGDRRQRGIEYMLTLPYSRSRILLAKLLPRLAAIILYAVLLFIMYYALDVITISTYHGVLAIIALGFLLFIVSFSLSAGFDNFLILFTFACVAFFFVAISLYFIIWAGFELKGAMDMQFNQFISAYLFSSSGSVYLIIMMLMVIPFLGSFYLAFRKFDTKHSANFNKMQLKYFMLLYLVVGIVSLICSVAI